MVRGGETGAARCGERITRTPTAAARMSRAAGSASTAARRRPRSAPCRGRRGLGRSVLVRFPRLVPDRDPGPGARSGRDPGPVPVWPRSWPVMVWPDSWPNGSGPASAATRPTSAATRACGRSGLAAAPAGPGPPPRIPAATGGPWPAGTRSAPTVGRRAGNGRRRLFHLTAQHRQRVTARERSPPGQHLV